MPKTCVVPGCSSNYKSSLKSEGYVQCFVFPKDSVRRSQWIRAIPRSQWTPTDCSVVCIKHFHKDDLELVEKYINSDGNVCQFRRNKPVLRDGAVPSQFPNLPSYLSDSRKSIKRRSPEERKLEEERRQKKKEDDDRKRFEKEDKILNFETFKRLVREKVDTDLLLFLSENKCLIYKLDVSTIPEIKFSCSVNNNLIVEVHVNGGLISNSNVLNKFNIPILSNSFLEKWSQLNDVIDFCSNVLSGKRGKTILLGILNDTCDSLIADLEQNPDDYVGLNATTENSDLVQSLSFLRDQICLLFMKKNKYNLETILKSFLIYVQSTKCYNAIRLNNLLTLPHPRFLQKLTASFKLSPSNEDETSHFLKAMCKDLPENDKIVSIQIDEIHIKESIDFKNGKLSGIASNESTEIAKTVVTFLVSSCFGKFKEVIRLVPAKQITGAFLANTAKNVIVQVLDCGFKVLCIISDNNRLNRVMFKELTRDSTSDYYFYTNGNPYPIYVFFDSVHILKCIRNNWINLKNNDHEFTVPFWKDLVDYKNTEIENNNNEQHDMVTKAKFSDLRDLYKIEQNMLVKSAPNITYKTLYPNNFERQKVSLALNVFNDCTAAALEKQNNHGTAYFIKVVISWWSIVNVKRPLTNILKRDPLQSPFSDINDNRFAFFDSFLIWLSKWKILTQNQPSLGCLTIDTFQALHHTTTALKLLIQYAIVDIQVPYVLTGKLQTDNLEARFGQYRQLAGGNYNVTVTQIIEAEKKIRIKSFLGLHSARYGKVELSAKLLEECNIINKPNIKDCQAPVHASLYSVLEEDYLDNITCDESGLIYICGYASFKISTKIACKTCSTLIKKDDESGPNDSYFNSINRGGLSVPSDFVLAIAKHVIGISQALLSERYETLFLSTSCQKNTVCKLSNLAVNLDNSIEVDLKQVCECGTSNETLALYVISIIANIMLNNYTKMRNDALKQVKNTKRKLNIFSK